MSFLPLPRRMKEVILSILPRFGYRLIAVKHGIAHSSELNEAFRVQAKLLSLLAQPNPIIFDVGSNTGQAYQLYRQVFPAALIHCFEPFPASMVALAETVAGDSLVRLHSVALASREGVADFNVNANSQTNSLLDTEPASTLFWGDGLLETQAKIQVQQVSLDRFVDSHSIPRISILKLDVQGSEYDVLLGARCMLQRQEIDIIYLEIILSQTYEGQRPLQDYLSIMAENGYNLIDVYNPYHKGVLLNQVDIIFVSGKLYQLLLASEHLI